MRKPDSGTIVVCAREGPGKVGNFPVLGTIICNKTEGWSMTVRVSGLGSDRSEASQMPAGHEVSAVSGGLSSPSAPVLLAALLSGCGGDPNPGASGPSMGTRMTLWRIDWNLNETISLPDLEEALDLARDLKLNQNSDAGFERIWAWAREDPTSVSYADIVTWALGKNDVDTALRAAKEDPKHYGYADIVTWALGKNDVGTALRAAKEDPKHYGYADIVTWALGKNDVDTALRAAKEDPSHADYCDIVEWALRRNDVNIALRAAKANPDRTNYHAIMAWTLARGEVEKAFAVAREDPNHYGYIDIVEWALKKKDVDTALQAAREDPNHYSYNGIVHWTQTHQRADLERVLSEACRVTSMDRDYFLKSK